jgi:hypothetical protein
MSVITLKRFHFNEKVLKNQLLNKAVRICAELVRSGFCYRMNSVFGPALTANRRHFATWLSGINLR